MIGRAGLSAISNPDGSLQTFPSWCSWVPFADYMETCTPPTAEQEQAARMASVGARMDPALVAQLQKQWASDLAADCAANPDPCQELRRYQACAAQYGTGFLGRLMCSSSVGQAIDPTTLILLVVAGLVILQR